jgi:riboflavin synthase
MFTGIIEALGRITRSESKGKDLVLSIDTGGLDLSDVKLGDSIAVNGVCLTVVTLGAAYFTADVSAESLIHTNLKSYKAGMAVNLEKALTLSTRLGGHLVSGHVDGVGELIKREAEGRSIRFDVRSPENIKRYIANKGSVTVDGVSLTVTRLFDEGFSLNIVPHTAKETTIESYQAGQRVHIEVDLMARYAERLLQREDKDVLEQTGQKADLDKSFLAQHGFLK